jgi:hypothetical protein
MLLKVKIFFPFDIHKLHNLIRNRRLVIIKQFYSSNLYSDTELEVVTIGQSFTDESCDYSNGL